MILKPISKYALVNAKVRSRLSTLLPIETINRLAETRDLSEFYSALGGLRKDILPPRDHIRPPRG